MENFMKKMIIFALGVCLVFGVFYNENVYANESDDILYETNDYDENQELNYDLPHLYSDKSKERALLVSYVVVDKKVCIRKGPGSKYDCVGYAYKDDIIYAIEVKNNWVMFKINGEKRYIYLDHLKKK